MKTFTALLFLSAIIGALAGTYKGTQSKKIGRKTYKCTFNINYTTSPPKCGQKTVKCKPGVKKTVKFAPIDVGDGTVTVSVAKNKVTACKVEAKASTEPATTNPPPTTVPPPTAGPVIDGEDMSCNCVLPTVTPTLGRSLDMDKAVTAVLLKTKEGTEWATARLAAPADNGNGTYKWVYDKEEHKFVRKYCKPNHVAPVVPGVSNLLPVLLLAGLAGLLAALGGQAVIDAIIAALGRSLEIQDVEEREAEQARILEMISDRQGLLGLLNQNNGGGLGNGGLLGNLGGNNGGLLGNLGNGGLLGGNAPAPAPGGLLGSLLGGAGGNAPAPAPAPAPGGLLGSLLGGANDPTPGGNLLGLLGGGGNGGLAGLLAGGNGGIQEAIMQAALNQILENPESLQGVISAAVESGMAEQAVTDMISGGQLEELAQNLLQNGQGQEMINNLMPEGGVEALQQNLQDSVNQSIGDVLGGMEPGSLQALLEGVDMENMEMKLQCKCVRNLPTDTVVG